MAVRQLATNYLDEHEAREGGLDIHSPSASKTRHRTATYRKRLWWSAGGGAVALVVALIVFLA